LFARESSMNLQLRRDNPFFIWRLDATRTWTRMRPALSKRLKEELRENTHNYNRVYGALLSSIAAVGQQDGVPPFSIADVHEVDTVDLLTLVPTLNISVQSKPGPIPFNYTLTSQQVCYQYVPDPSHPTAYILCGTDWFTGVPSGLVASSAVSQATGSNWCTGNNGIGWYTYYTHWVIKSKDGLDVHPVDPNLAIYNCGGPTSFTTTTTDGSALTLSVSLNVSTGVQTVTITSAHGESITSYTGGPSTKTVTDPNGNTATMNVNLFTDSLGVQTLTASEGPYSYSGSYQWHDTRACFKNRFSLTSGTYV